MKHNPHVLAFFEPNSSTFSYLVIDPNSKQCAIVDSVLDFDYASGQVGYLGADKIIKCVESKGLQLEWLLETHVHADHLSAAPYIKSKLGGKIAIGKDITDVQKEFGGLFNECQDFDRDGSQFDVLLEDGERYMIGTLEAHAMATPGHTPACMTHIIGDAAFVGDTVFMPDSGTARADFPGGDAKTLYQSIQKILALAPSTRLFMCHDYPPEGRELEYQCTVADQRMHNIHINDNVSEKQYVELREARDAKLPMPRLILPSLQVNMRAGHFPPAEDNDVHYLKVPISGLNGKPTSNKPNNGNKL